MKDGFTNKAITIAVVVLISILLPLTGFPTSFANAEGSGKLQHSSSTDLSHVSQLSRSITERRLLEEVADGKDGFVRQGKLLVDKDGVEGRTNGKASSAVLGGAKGLVDAFLTSMSMILVSEIGDETFIIAALMAMRHPRSIVLAGALSALIIMTVLSTGLGLIVPNLISKKATNSAATILYTFFGLRLLYIAWRADPKDTPQKELEEVEEKLEGEEKGKGKFQTSAIRRIFSRVCTPIFLEAFILTFLAEWGDRSQIATIALAAHKNPIGVTIGASLGHVICTSFAVVGGRLLALRISQRAVAMMGGILFLIFAVHSSFFPSL